MSNHHQPHPEGIFHLIFWLILSHQLCYETMRAEGPEWRRHYIMRGNHHPWSTKKFELLCCKIAWRPAFDPWPWKVSLSVMTDHCLFLKMYHIHLSHSFVLSWFFWLVLCSEKQFCSKNSMPISSQNPHSPTKQTVLGVRLVLARERVSRN